MVSLALYQLSSLLLSLNQEAYRNSRQSCVQMLTFSQPLRETKRKANADSGFGLGELLFWWNNSLDGVMLPEEWKEKFRMGKDNFYKLCGELRPFIQRKVTNMARWRGLFYSFLDSFNEARAPGNETVTSVPCERFQTVLFSMRFQGHETVSIGNRVRVNDALVY